MRTLASHDESMPTRTTETARVPEDISGRQRRMPVGGVTWRHTFRALRHRNYRLFFWGQLVSLIGTWMQQTAMSWFVYQITNSKLLARRGGRSRIRADDAFIDLGRRAGRSLSETIDPRGDASGANDLRISARRRCVARIRRRLSSSSSLPRSTASRWDSTCPRARRSPSK